MPVVDALSGEYGDEVTFLAVAGRSSLEATAAVAADLLPSGNFHWVLDESIWETYEVFGQPVTFAISANGVIIDSWFGLRPEPEIRSVLNLLAGTAI